MADQAYREESRHAERFVASTIPGFERIVSVRSGMAKVLARYPAVRRTLSRFGPAVSVSSLAYEERKRRWTSDPTLTEINRFLDANARDLHLSALWILNAAGDCVADSNAGAENSRIGTHYSDRGYFRAAHDGRSGYEITLRRRESGAGFTFYAPIIDKGRFAGAMVGGIELSTFINWLDPEDAFLTDRNGVVVLARDASLTMHAMAGAPVGKLDAATRQALYKRMEIPEFEFKPWGDERFPQLLRMQGRSAPVLLHSQSTGGGEPTVNVVVSLPQLAELQQQRTFYTLIAGGVGSLLMLLAVVVLARIRERQASQLVLDERAEQDRRQLQFFGVAPGCYTTTVRRPDGSYAMPFASEGIRDLFGIAPEDVKQDTAPLAVICHPDDIAMTHREAEESARTLNPYSVEYRIIHPQKGVRWIEVSSLPQRMPDGGTRWDGFMHDITGRKQAEARLLRSEHGLAEAQRITRLGNWELDLVSNVLTWSDEIYRIFEIAPEEFGASYEAFVNAIHPEDREMVHKAYTNSVKNKVPYDIVHRLQMPDGRIKYVNEKCVTYYGEDGKPLRSIGTVHDITEMKNAQRQMAQFIANFPGFAYSFRLSREGHGSFPFASPGIENIYGLMPEDVKEDMAPLHALAHPDDRSRILEVLAESARTMTSLHVEYRICRPGLPERWSEFRSSPVREADGSMVWHGIMVDIDERKAVEEERTILAQALDHSSDAVFLVDLRQRIRFVNAAACRSLGYSREELLTKSTLDIDPDLTPEDCERMKAAALRSGDATFSVEARHRRCDGSIYPVEILLTPCWHQGELMNFAVARDITERKQAEHRLRQALEFSESVINAIPDLLFEVDSDGRYLNVWAQNPVLLAMKKEVFLGKTIPEILPSVAAEISMEAIREADERGLSVGKTIRLELADGEHWFELSISEIKGRSPSRKRFLVLSRDVSEQKRYEAAREDALIEAMRLANLRSEFLTHMSHELRTPLNGILGYAQILQRDKALGERNAAALNVIRQSGEYLLALIDDILDFARIEAGRFELVIGDIPLHGFLRIVAEIIGIKAREKGLEFSCDLAPDLPAVVRGDEKRLRQVLLNLLANAVKYTESGWVVLRVCCTTPSHLAFAVEDSGIGIEESELKRIFHPFEQAGDSRRWVGGSGLGLAISRRLVRLMGGEISVESRIGNGSTFSFELQLPMVAISSTSLTMPNMTGYIGPRRKVLVVDDAVVNRTVVVDYLAPLGFETIEACDGVEALELAQCALPDLILMDSAMPGMDGLEAIRRLRLLPALEHVPIVVLSASTPNGDETKCMEAGANAFMEKPFDQDRLMALIAGLLHLEWMSTPQSSAAAGASNEPLLAPPTEEIQTLHRLAQLGSMRDITAYAEYIAGIDPCYASFAARLIRMAAGYQSKAILAFVEQYLHETAS